MRYYSEKKNQKYNAYTYNTLIPLKYSNLNFSNTRDYYIISEDEKTNSLSNNFISNKYNSKTTYNQLGSKLLNTNRYKNSNCQKNYIIDNFSNLPNNANYFLNSNVKSKKSKHIMSNCIGDSLKFEPEPYYNNTINNMIQLGTNQSSFKTLTNQDVNNDKNNYQINEKYNNYNKENKFNLSDKLSKNDNIVMNNYKLGNIHTITEENEYIYNSKINPITKRNYETSIINYNNKNNALNLHKNIIKNNKTKKYEYIKKNILNINIRSSYKLNKKKINNNLQNSKSKNEKDDKKSINNSALEKKIDSGKKKLSFRNILNSSNTNDSSQKNNSIKNNHSFFEVKSLSKFFNNSQVDPIKYFSKKKTIDIKNNIAVLNISSKNNNESNIKQNNNNNKKIIINTTQYHLLKSGDKKVNKDNDIKSAELSKYILKDNKKNILLKDIKNNAIDKTKINNLNNNKNYPKSYYIKVNEKIKVKTPNANNTNTKVNMDNNYKIIEPSPKRSSNNNVNSNIKKNRTLGVDTYFLNYFPSSNTDKKINKKLSSKKNQLELKNLIYKTFEEDFPIKIKDNKKTYLKPQIAARIILFNIIKPENERYYLMNYLYSENIKNPIFKESEI